jgi:CSLREA domain-containing protein
MDGGQRRGNRATSALLAVFVALVVAGTSAVGGTRAAVAMTFTVDSTGDGADASIGDGICADASGRCTLRAAIAESNASVGSKDTIAFAIPGAGVHTIVHPSTGGNFLVITDAVAVDGLSQGGPGYAGPPLVEIDANGRNLLFNGAATAASELRGIAFFAGVVQFNNSERNTVEHAFIGTDATGATRRGGGLEFHVSAENTISDNVLAGGLGLDRSSDNTVLRNMIGTDPEGKFALAPTGSGSGVGVLDGHRNLFSENVIAGFTTGISLVSASTPNADNRIEGNLVGTDITGELPLENAGTGISLGGRGTNNSVVGNVISANGAGITAALFQENVIVRGNRIGTDIDGEADLGNRGIGVNFDTGSGVLIADNVISGNGGDGIVAGSSLPLSVRIEGNRIGTNASARAASQTTATELKPVPAAVPR